MPNPNTSQALPPLYTGKSPFLAANPHLIRAMVQATAHCRIQSSEDIFDVNGFKLWARGQPVDATLLDRLANRPLRKPIELCVTAQDPVSTLSMLDIMDTLGRQSPDFAALMADHLPAFRAQLQRLRPSPQALLLLSVMRYGPRELLSHALAVTALSFMAARWLALDAANSDRLLRASLLHDTGWLYLPDKPSDTGDGLALRQHTSLGALAAKELAGLNVPTADLIAHSHERLDGSGLPQGLLAKDLTPAMRALSFAEAVADLLCTPPWGMQRAAVAVSLVPGEFDANLVGHMHSHWQARTRQLVMASMPLPVTQIGVDLRHLHAELSRVIVMLSLPFGEAEAIVEQAQHGLTRLQPLMQALRRAGLEFALVQGQIIEPGSLREAIELSTLKDEIQVRMQATANAMEKACAASSPMAGNRFLAEATRLLRSACKHPPPSAQPAAPKET